jgi:ABC-type spermidine/putrescine transport system permease subunit II
MLCCGVLWRAMQAFAKGAGPFLEAVQEHDFLHATKLTLMLAAIAVPLNTLFGTVAAILITRNEFPGKVSHTEMERAVASYSRAYTVSWDWAWAHAAADVQTGREGAVWSVIPTEHTSTLATHPPPCATPCRPVGCTACRRVQVLLLSLLDLPFSISPVVTGLMLMLLYGRAGWFAQALAENGWNIVFAFPGADWHS